jgi:hypothetical protein
VVAVHDTCRLGVAEIAAVRSSIAHARLCFAVNFNRGATRARGAKPTAVSAARRTLRADSWSWEVARTRMILGEADGGRKQVDSGRAGRAARARRARVKAWSVPTIRSTHGA